MNKLVLGVMALTAATASADPKPDLAAIAEKIVTKGANVKEGEIVEIAVGPRDLELAEELAVAVHNHGAFGVIVYLSDNEYRKELAGPAKYDSKTDAGALALAKAVNVRITLEPLRDNSVFDKLTPERAAVMRAAGKPILDTLQKRSVRQIDLSNQLAPSADRAKDYGITEAELAKIWMNGLAADYSAIQTKGGALKDLFAKGAELHITNPNGTDIKMKVKGRKSFVSDGVLTDEEVKQGGAAVNSWLPAGEFLIAPVPGTAEGTIVDDRWTYLGKEMLGVTAEVKAGKITNITAKSGWDAYKSFADSAPAAGKEISGIDIGLNPAIKSTPKMRVFAAAGLISITTGYNVHMGGTNTEPFALAFQLAGSTITLDGVTIVDAGVLK
ncbi:MAG: aminopeptidase [Kofleriaceae bacterium]